MTWSIVGVGAVVEVTATSHALTEPAGVAAGDLLVACIASRIASTSAITMPFGWLKVTDQRISNITAGTTGQASACMAYIVRGASAPALTFTHPSAPNVARGQIVAYRENTTDGISTDAFSNAATATALTAINLASSVTTLVASDLLVGMVAGGSAATYTAFKTANAPSTASGATNTSSAPSTTTWTERADASSATGADVGLAVFDAVKTATGAGGAITATASVSSGHSVIMAAFRAVVPTADAWNLHDVNVFGGMTLSGSDKTATATAACGIRSTAKHDNGTAGKYYAEFFLGSASLPTVGILPIGTSMVSNNAAFLMTNAGAILINAGNPSTGAMNIGTPVVNDVVCVAWDAGAERVWFRLNGNAWNASGTADPATGAEGIDASFAAATPHALWMRATASGMASTIRTELADLTQAVPTGFMSWMGETPAVTDKTLAAVAGAYALTGAAATPELGRRVTADVSSYALTGTDATLVKGAAAIAYNLPAVAGTYTLSGAAAGLYRGREVLAVAGSYGLSGTTTSLEYGRETAAVPGAYTLSGATTSLEYGREVLAVAGFYGLSGVAASLERGREALAVAGSYTLTGVTATLAKSTLVHRTVPAVAGSYTLTGAPTTLLRARVAPAVAGTYTLSGTAATFRRTWKTTAVSGAYALTGIPVNLLKPGAYAIIGLPGVYAVSGTTATLAKGGIALRAKVWTGSAWVAKPAKVWTGAVWASKPVKVWNGSAWV